MINDVSWTNRILWYVKTWSWFSQSMPKIDISFMFILADCAYKCQSTSGFSYHIKIPLYINVYPMQDPLPSASSASLRSSPLFKDSHLQPPRTQLFRAGSRIACRVAEWLPPFCTWQQRCPRWTRPTSPAMTTTAIAICNPGGRLRVGSGCTASTWCSAACQFVKNNSDACEGGGYLTWT